MASVHIPLVICCCTKKRLKLSENWALRQKWTFYNPSGSAYKIPDSINDVFVRSIDLSHNMVHYLKNILCNVSFCREAAALKWMQTHHCKIYKIKYPRQIFNRERLLHSALQLNRNENRAEWAVLTYTLGCGQCVKPSTECRCSYMCPF